MAIDTGLGVTCTDLQATGGIKQILLRSWASADAVVYGNAAGDRFRCYLYRFTSNRWY